MQMSPNHLHSDSFFQVSFDEEESQLLLKHRLHNVLELSLSYNQDEIALHGEVSFPNLDFECNMIDFGCIINDTEAAQYITVTNNSPLLVCYKWSFAKREDDPCPAESTESIDTEIHFSTTKGLFTEPSVSRWCLSPNDPYEVEVCI